MKRWMISFGVLVGLFLWIGSAHSAEGAKFAYLDAQKILDATKAGQQAKKLMEEYRDSRQKIIDLEEDDIKRLQDNLVRQQSVLDPEARRGKEEVLQRKMVAYQQRVGEFTRELDGKKREILLEFNKGLIDTVKRIADKEGYTFVFDRNAEGGVLLFAQPSFDITERVIKEYDEAKP